MEESTAPANDPENQPDTEATEITPQEQTPSDAVTDQPSSDGAEGTGTPADAGAVEVPAGAEPPPDEPAPAAPAADAAQPEAPAEAEAAVESEAPAKAEAAVGSEAPAEADVEPDTPAEPATPAEAETPAEPSTPAEPDVPAEPSTPAEAETPAEAATPAEPEAATVDQAADGAAAPTSKRKGKKKGQAQGAEGEAAADKPAAEKKPKKPSGPDPAEVTRKVGSTNEAALRYVASPDPQLSRLSRKVREDLITEIPPVTAGALLGPEALARHFIASAASGRYRDLFSLWDLFRTRPDAVKPVLAERQRALERARQALTTAVKLGLRGHAERVAEDVSRAEGLIWTWLREILEHELAAVGRRPAVVAALSRRDPTLTPPLPDDPSDAWLAEAAALKQTPEGAPPAIDALLSSHIERLPATVATLTLVSESFPDRVGQLVERVDLSSPEIVAILAWARDHGVGDRLKSRISQEVSNAADRGRAEGLSTWQTWHDRGVDVPMPSSLQDPTIEGLDLTRPESATLIATLVGQGAAINAQGVLDELASQNRQAAEKAYESFVCAELDVHLPLVLEGNPIVKEGTRCPACQAWTWVRPGHEKRCPRLRSDQQEAEAQAAPPEQQPAPAPDTGGTPAPDTGGTPAPDTGGTPAPEQP